MDNLIKKARSGNKKAFAELYIAYKDKLFRYAYFKLGNRDDAMDAVSNCITQSYMGISSLKNEKVFSAWIFRILYRECCAMLTQKSQNANNQSLDGINIEADCDPTLAPELKEALSILSEEEKDIVLLSVVAGYNSKEIAKMFGLKDSTVRSKQMRALGKMRSFLE